MDHNVYLALGSNLDEPLEQLKKAVKHIAEINHVSVKAVSSVYLTAPMGPQGQPDFYNAVMNIETSLEPHQLHKQLFEIEVNQGRVHKSGPWGQARTIDIDILLYGDKVISDEGLTIPHVGLMERDFFIEPLVELSPNICHPDGRCVKSESKVVSQFIKELLPRTGKFNLGE